jgi:hypothetical protein
MAQWEAWEQFAWVNILKGKWDILISHKLFTEKQIYKKYDEPTTYSKYSQLIYLLTLAYA